MDQALIMFRDSILGILSKLVQPLLAVVLVALLIWALLQIRKQYKYWMG